MSTTSPNLLAASKQTTSVELFQATLKAVPAAMSTLLAEYSSIAPAEQEAHITAVRNRAYASYPYPCLGRWRFLDLDLTSHPLYQSEILPAVSKPIGKRKTHDHDNGKTEIEIGPDDDWIFLDLGCCLGQDLRKLIYDGADVHRLYGADLNPEFLDIGYALFGDQASFPRDAHFIAPANVFDFSDSSELARRCDGRVGILHCTAVFHLFGLDEQRDLARRCLKLLLGGKQPTPPTSTSQTQTAKPLTRKRALICGAQTANISAGEYPRSRGSGSRYRHNEQSWRQFWEEVVAQDKNKDESDPYGHKIVSVDVHSTLEERTFVNTREGEAKSDSGNTNNNNNANTTQRQIGRVEEGFRWMKWWVWVDYL